ncbi:MAG: hypothetical protein R3243_01355 [Arenibacter latericius]|nr:hypothetical protein [Arenibacter latericius]
MEGESQDSIDEATLISLKKSKEKPIYVTVPFKAAFLGDYQYVGPDIEVLTGLEPKGCEAARVIVDFEGNGTHLGKFTGNFDFCAGPEGYGPSDSYMVAANGDTLIVSIAGNVIQGRMDDHPEYVTSYWRDSFVIIGGTGRFEGATGSGMSDDYNSSLDINSHHNWTGTITMIKGKSN